MVDRPCLLVPMMYPRYDHYLDIWYPISFPLQQKGWRLYKTTTVCRGPTFFFFYTFYSIGCIGWAFHFVEGYLLMCYWFVHCLYGCRPRYPSSCKENVVFQTTAKRHFHTHWSHCGSSERDFFECFHFDVHQKGCVWCLCLVLCPFHPYSFTEGHEVSTHPLCKTWSGPATGMVPYSGWWWDCGMLWAKSSQGMMTNAFGM